MRPSGAGKRAQVERWAETARGADFEGVPASVRPVQASAHGHRRSDGQGALRAAPRGRRHVVRPVGDDRPDE
ncbi:hypothetical protein E1292_43210 [Nonomuraea deserti]|uniref:Uncharacterized protein n=1 Tax=Nonomuraea deserti TaxID=1848322 RepID=A0A4R4UH39_9ACTN|nr:hypothetical protein E1292_43210 [Nonomuraea deserti]